VEARSGSPKVSIITPAYNSAAFLAETVHSVLGQTFSDFELLIVDDASTDETIETARQLMAEDGRVRAWTVPHGGPALARNAAMAEARGRVFALLDSDDTWKPTYLQEQVDLLECFRSASVVTANAINRGGPFDGRPLWPVLPGVIELRLIDLLSREDSVCIMSVFRREVFHRIGGFDPAFNGNEDYEFWLRTAAAGFVFLQNRQPLGYYRRRSGSLSGDDGRMVRGLVAVLGKVAAEMDLGPSERLAVESQLTRFRRQMVRTTVRECLDRRNARDALRSLQARSDAYGSRFIGLAARIAAAWPQPLLWLYDARRARRSAASSRQGATAAPRVS
jgi:glycosyltransferase involved in cell wall biosynthesis